MPESNLAEGNAQPPVKARRPRWRWLRRLLKLVAVVYVSIAIVIYAIQDRLVFPGHATQGTRQAQVEESTSYELLNLKTSSGSPIVAIFGHAFDANGRPIDDPSHSPTILYFYGNGMSLADCFAEFRRFRMLGCNVLIPEYVGYGMSGGKPSEAASYSTADAAYDYLQSRPDIDHTKIISAGWSLGGAVAIDLAERRKVAGLITFSAFSSMTNMGRLMFPWLPTSLFLRSRFDSIDKIGRVEAPILLVHGRHDSLVPFTMQHQLSDAARKTGRIVTVLTVDTNHMDVFESDSDELNEGLRKFVQSITQSP